MKPAARLVYGTLGSLILAVSFVALFRPSLALHPDELSPLTSHLVQEQGAEGTFIGLMALWCAWGAGRNRPVRLGLVVFAGLFAAIHWLEYAHGRRSLVSPLVNSLPLVLFAAVAPWRRASD